MQKLGDAIGKAINMQMVQKELPQGQIYQFNLKGAALPVTPGWTFADNFLVISTTPDALETALRLAAGQSDSSLAASPAYQQVATETGGRVTSVFLLNAQKLEALVDRIPAQQHTAGTGQPGSVGRTQNPDMEKMKGALRALRGLSAISTVDGDAVIMKMTLSFDLTR